MGPWSFPSTRAPKAVDCWTTDALGLCQGIVTGLFDLSAVEPQIKAKWKDCGQWLVLISGAFHC